MKSVNNGSNLILKVNFDEAHTLAEGLRKLILDGDENASVLLDDLMNKRVVDIDADYNHEGW